MNDNDDILRKIEQVCLDIIKDVRQHKPPKLCFPRRSNWDELTFDDVIKLNPVSDYRAYSTVDTRHPKSLKKFGTKDAEFDPFRMKNVGSTDGKCTNEVKIFYALSVMLKVMKTIYTLIQENRFCTKRDIFYQYPDLYSSQASMDKIIDDIACMLKVPRWDLHILATSKGLIAGDVQFEEQTGLSIDCQYTQTGIPVAAHMKDMQNIITTARFVLVVEKDATFQKLMEYQFCQKMKPCILMTGKGFPDNGTRLLLKQLWLQYNLPIFILVDADPHGIEIMSVYKYGSMSQAFENHHLAVPQAEWIGVWPEDISRLNITESTLARMTQRDFQKAESLKRRPYAKNDETFLSQIDLLIESGHKAEIQSLDSISPNYLCDVYLPSKINLLYPSIQ